MPVYMGSYGIGISRALGTVAELRSDEAGLAWPESIAPFRVHLVAFGDESVFAEAERLYDQLTSAGVEVLYDDRPDARPGEKLADADLLGMPLRVLVSKRALEQGGFEFKKRTGADAIIISKEDLLGQLIQK